MGMPVTPARKLDRRAANRPRREPAARSVRKDTPVERLRVHHRMEALLCLRDRGSMSQIELCTALGRSTTTMSKVVTELEALGWVAAAGSARPREPGRPRTVLRLNPAACETLCLSLEPGLVRSAVVGLDLIARDAREDALALSDGEPAEILRRLTDWVRARLAELARRRCRPAAVVLVMPGMTDTKLRHIRISYQLGWRDLPLADHIEAKIGTPVIAHNNTRAMAFAEFRHRHLDADQPMLFVQAKYGVGASMLNGITPSPHGHYGVSELGHLRMGENRFADRVATDGTLVGVLREPYLRDVLGCRDMKIQIVEEMERRANAKDKVAVALFDQTIANLALCLAVAINLQNPSIVVLGGIYAGLSDATLERLLTEIARNVPDELMQPVRLSRTALGPAGAIQGAAIVGFDRLLRQPDTYRAVEAT